MVRMLKNDAKDYWRALQRVYREVGVSTRQERDQIRRELGIGTQCVRGYAGLWDRSRSERVRQAYANLLECRAILARTRSYLRGDRAFRRVKALAGK